MCKVMAVLCFLLLQAPPNEQGIEADFVEIALAHVDDNQVRSAYNRTDYHGGVDT